jgi:rubrerythrin
MSELNDSLYRGLQSTFEAESANVQRYAFFAQIAEIEGHGETARLFRELADSLAVAAQGHLDHLRQVDDPATRLPIGGTEHNLAAALAGELDEGSGTYRALAEEARSEELPDLASWFETLVALKRAHVARLERALDLLHAGASPAEPR